MYYNDFGGIRLRSEIRIYNDDEVQHRQTAHAACRLVIAPFTIVETKPKLSSRWPAYDQMMMRPSEGVPLLLDTEPDSSVDRRNLQARGRSHTCEHRSAMQ